jgi:hypothetical protein
MSASSVIDTAVADLSRRDADIAVRMFRAEQLDLVARKTGHVAPRVSLAPLGTIRGHAADLRNNAAVRAVFDALCNALATHCKH